MLVTLKSSKVYLKAIFVVASTFLLWLLVARVTVVAALLVADRRSLFLLHFEIIFLQKLKNCIPIQHKIEQF